MAELLSVTGLEVGSTTVDITELSKVLPTLSSTNNLPVGTTALLDESFFLDPDNADLIATAASLSRGDVLAAIEEHNLSAHLP